MSDVQAAPLHAGGVRGGVGEPSRPGVQAGLLVGVAGRERGAATEASDAPTDWDFEAPV